MLSRKSEVYGLEVLCPKKARSTIAGMKCGMNQDRDNCGKGCRYKAPPEVVQMLYGIRFREAAAEAARLKEDQETQVSSVEERRARFALLFGGGERKKNFVELPEVA